VVKNLIPSALSAGKIPISGFTTDFLSMKRIAIIAAMPGELKPLVRGWPRKSRHGVNLWRRRHGENEWIAACAGVGVDAAKRALEELKTMGWLIWFVPSAGRERCARSSPPGQAYRVSGIIEARSGDRFSVSVRPVPRNAGW